MAGAWLRLKRKKADTAHKWQNASLQLFTENKADQLSAMNSDELSMYSYLLATKGKDAADEFFGLVEESLNQRVGTREAEALQESKIGGIAAPIAGFQGAVTGGVQAIGALAGKELPTSSLQYTSQEVRNDLNTVPGALYDVAYTMGNMAPSIAASAMLGGVGVPAKLASAIGSLALGTSSAGNSYKEGLEKGYTQEQAVTYGILNGASEAGMQYALGGISKLGAGVVSGKIAGGLETALGKVIKNPQIVTAVAELIASMGSEAAEEYIQEVLSPVWGNIAAGEHNAVEPFSQEALYAAILGALTAGLLEGPGVAVSQRTATTPAGPSVDAQAEIVAPTAENPAQASAQGVNQANKEPATSQDTVPVQGSLDSNAPNKDINLPKLEQNPDVVVVGDMASDTPNGIIGLPRKATAEEIAADTMTRKSQEYKARHEKKFIETVSEAFGVPKTSRSVFSQTVAEIGDAIVRTEKVDDATLGALFEDDLRRSADF